MSNTYMPASSLSSPASVEFHGPSEAPLFAREAYESLAGLMRRNFCGRFDAANAGFLHASIDGRPWENTMWPRDAAVVLREFVHWGHFEEAILLADALISLVRPNEAGFHCYPECFHLGEPATGNEVDGTTGTIIALCLLWQRLPEDHAARTRIHEFLNAAASPVRWILAMLERRPLIAGSGEFGGGCGIPGLHCNVVQNGMCRLALVAAADLYEAAGDGKLAKRCRAGARALEQAIEKHLVATDGSWTWCVNPETLQPDPEILNHPMNRGFGGLNGVAAMQSDVLGLDATDARWFGRGASAATFEALLNTPLRRQQFEKYGIWTQFDEPPLSLMMSPSYGQGYALQTMLLLGRTDLAAHGLRFLAEYTFRPPKRYHIDRESPYWFFERYVSPDEENPKIWDQACGALNAVCVGEPLKVARLIIGIDDCRPDEVVLMPRLPDGWEGYDAQNWPVRTSTGLARLDVACRKDDEGLHVNCRARHGVRLPALRIRSSAHVWQEKNVAECAVDLPA